jgi:uncharacterized protein YbjT (DUF2867 family)
MQIKSVCILGGSGFVGRHLAHQLVERSLSLKVLTRRRETAKHLIPLPSVDVVEANVFDTNGLARHFEGQDAVINLVGILHERKHRDFQDVHARLPEAVIDACRQTGVKRLLHMSALGADAGSKSAYQRSKAEGERHVHDAADIHSTIFRPSVIFGRDDSFLNLFARIVRIAPVLPLAGATARFQPVWVEDVARAFALAVDNPATFGRTYNLCGPRVYTLQELVQVVADCLKLRPRIIPLGDTLSLLQARLMEVKPGSKLMTRDNVYAMRQDNVCPGGFPEVFGFAPTPLETVVPTYLNPEICSRFDRHRHAARR